MPSFPRLAVAACALLIATPAAAQFLQVPPSAMVDNSVNAPGARPPADSTPLVDNSVDNSVRTVPPGLKNPDSMTPPPAPTPAPAPAPAAPMTDSKYPYISGGISEEGRDGFLAAHAGEGYTAKMLFTGPQGNMLADVDVTVKTAKGEEVIRARTDGPLLLAKLPAGSYRVDASYKGETKRASLNVRKSGMASSVIRFSNGD